MWFDSCPTWKPIAAPQPGTRQPVLVEPLAEPFVESLAASEPRPHGLPLDCPCFIRTLTINTGSHERSQQLIDLVSAFGDLQSSTNLGNQVVARFFDCRDCYKALTLVPKFSECRNYDVEPIKEPLQGVLYKIDPLVSKEELWYQVSKHGDIAWSKVVQQPGTTTVYYAVFDKRVIEKLAQTPIDLNGRLLLAQLTPIDHDEICRFKPKDNVYSPSVSTSSLVSTNSGDMRSKTGMASPPLSVAQLADDKSPDFSMQIPGHLTPPMDSSGFQQIQKRHSRANTTSSTSSCASTESASSASSAASASASTSGTSGSRSNRVDCDLIKAGRERRTTVMLRNIPNKVNLAALRSFLDETNEKEYDFLYLRMDFNNKCNVGYAFINFTRAESVAKLTRARRGKKWTQYNSVKIIDVSFANIQGRRALIEKFRDSPIMAMDPAYRPKLYYTSGPLAGTEERFN